MGVLASPAWVPVCLSKSFQQALSTIPIVSSVYKYFLIKRDHKSYIIQEILEVLEYFGLLITHSFSSTSDISFNDSGEDSQDSSEMKIGYLLIA